MENLNDLVGKSYTFEDDGSIMTIVQIKNKDVNNSIVPFITYEISQANNLPRKLVMSSTDFIPKFGHLFGMKEPPKF